MKTYTYGLEVGIVDLTEKEIEAIEKLGLIGILNFRQPPENKLIRKIPFILTRRANQKEDILLEIFPKGKEIYFGHAKLIKFYINVETYLDLRLTGKVERRYHSSGKLEIISERIKYPSLFKYK